MTAPDISAWRGLELIEPMQGGARNPVFAARRGGARYVVRVSRRGEESLAWELDLLEHLAAHGVRVPSVVPTDAGDRHAHGVMVHEFLTGDRPASLVEWRRVVRTLRDVHELTREWPQRPGFKSSRRLLVATRGGDVDLAAMPADAVEVVRGCWEPVHFGGECAIHGDLGAGNVLVDGASVALLDWDESRVDVPWFDFAYLPPEVELVLPVKREQLATAGLAWEAATCWVEEPEYAHRVLRQLYERLEGCRA